MPATLRCSRITTSDEDLVFSGSEQHFIVYLRGAQPSHEVLEQDINHGRELSIKTLREM